MDHDKHDRHRGGFFPGKSLWCRHHLARIDQRVLGKATAAATHDPIAELEARHPFADLDNFAGGIATRDPLRRYALTGCGAQIAHRTHFGAVQR